MFAARLTKIGTNRLVRLRYGEEAREWGTLIARVDAFDW
jgi:hypothetical protein